MRSFDSDIDVIDHPFPHAILRNFLDLDAIADELEWLAGQEFEPGEADLFSYSSTRKLGTAKQLMGLYTALGDSIWCSQIAAAFRTPPLSHIDMAAYVYTQGDFLLPHDDRVAGRQIAYSLHLTRGLREGDGGALELFSSLENVASSVVKRIVPEFNSLVLFRVSPRSWHQVAEVIGDVQRLTVTGWYHG
jgi:Rps23 Pro-64 3,4-dihydroxylase Tpa1-like proline 4-hydroxylase